MRRHLIGVCVMVLGGTAPAHAINGGADAPAVIAAQTAQIVSTGGPCSATVIARDLLLTAAHCVQPKSGYAVLIYEGGAPRLLPISRVVLHPKYNPHQFETLKPSPDLAIFKLSEPLPASFRIAKLATAQTLPRPGDVFTLVGYGLAVDGDPKTAGKARAVMLPAVGTTGGIMVRFAASKGRAGACTGDSGGPAFAGDEVVAVIGWINTPRDRDCGAITGATLVALQRDWIVATARALGAAIEE